jgi:N-acetyl-alpha-D-glucosaminyl L-malate synthase BshA
MPESNAGIFILEQVRRLGLTRFQPIVLAPHFPGGKLQEWWPPVRIYRFPYFFPTRFERLAYGSGMFYNLRKHPFTLFTIPVFLISEIIFTVYHTWKSRVSLIHTHWLLPQGLVGSLIYRFLKVPHVATIHGSDLNIIKKHPLLYPLCRFIVQNADSITVNSSYMQQQLLDVVPGYTAKVRIIPMGVDPEKISTVPVPDRKEYNQTGKIILSVGRLVDVKGIVYLINALQEVLRQYPYTVLHIIGSGPDYASLVKRTSELGLENHIRFLGTVNHNDLQPYYRSADVFILPSITTGGISEAFGVVLLEAMAAGCPVIGSNTGGIPDIIVDGETGFLVPERDADALAEKIIRVLSDKPLREKFCRNGLVRVREKFSLDIVAEQFLEVYSSVLKK